MKCGAYFAGVSHKKLCAFARGMILAPQKNKTLTPWRENKKIEAQILHHLDGFSISSCPA